MVSTTNEGAGSLKATIVQTLVQMNDQLVVSSWLFHHFFNWEDPKPPDQELWIIYCKIQNISQKWQGNQNLFLLDFNFGDIVAQFAHQHPSPTVQITNQ